MGSWPRLPSSPYFLAIFFHTHLNIILVSNNHKSTISFSLYWFLYQFVPFYYQTIFTIYYYMKKVDNLSGLTYISPRENSGNHIYIKTIKRLPIEKRTSILPSNIYLLESTCFSVMKGDLFLKFNRNSLVSRSICTSINGSRN